MQAEARHTKHSFYPILLTFFLDTFGFAVVYPIFTPLFLQPSGILVSDSFSIIQKTFLLGILIALFPLAQFFGAPIIGEFSDEYGRKKGFIITIIGTGTGYLLTALGIMFYSVPLLFFSRLWTGFFAGNLTICLAATADLNIDEQTRAKNFGMLGGVGGIGYVLAILIGGILSNTQLNQKFNPSLPFLVTAGLSLLNLILVVILFKESHLTPRKMQINIWKGAHHIFAALKIKDLRAPYATYFFFMLCWVTSMQFLPTLLFSHFHLSALGVTWVFVGVGAIWSFSNFFINRYLSKRFSSYQILKATLLLLSIFIVLSIIPSMFPIFLILFYSGIFCAGLSWTNSLATVSISASKNIQGSSLGINQSFGALASVVGPIIGGIIAGHQPDWVYLFTGMASLCGFFVLRFMYRPLG